jgi:hypothetical protein
MSSRYTTTKVLVSGRRISSIILLKVAGAFFKPKVITNHSKRPSFDLKAVERLHINLTEVFGPRELIKEVVNLRNQVPVSNCDFFQSSIINTESPGSIFLMYQHDWALAR